jgi:hypothetical protein
VLDNKHKGNYGPATIRYKIVPADELNPEEKKIFKKIKWRAKNYNGTHTKRMDSFDRSLCFIQGEKWQVEQSLENLTNNDTDTKYIPFVPMKKKTREHFGGIMENIFKSKIEDMFNSGESYVLIMKHHYKGGRDRDLPGHKVKYILKPVDMITPEESAALNSIKTKEAHAYMHGYEVYDELGADEVEFIFDTEEELKDEVKTIKSLNQNISPEVPMKQKTKEHFGDIMEKASFVTVVSLLLEKYEMDEKIVAPAVKIGNKVVKGNRGEMHANVLEKIANRISTIHNVSMDKAFEIMSRMRKGGKVVEGFIDVNGRFATREKAYDIMKYFKAIKHDPIIDRGPGGNKFYSEEL